MNTKNLLLKSAMALSLIVLTSSFIEAGNAQERAASVNKSVKETAGEDLLVVRNLTGDFTQPFKGSLLSSLTIGDLKAKLAKDWNKWLEETHSTNPSVTVADIVLAGPSYVVGASGETKHVKYEDSQKISLDNLISHEASEHGPTYIGIVINRK